MVRFKGLRRWASLTLMKIKIYLKLVKHEEGYAIIIHIHVTSDGEARVSYDGDLTLAPMVMGKVKTIFEQEVQRKLGIIVRTKNKTVGMGEMVDGVLEKVTIMKEE